MLLIDHIIVISKLIFTSPRGGMRSIVISMSVCLYVCLLVCLSSGMSQRPRPYFRKFSVPAAMAWSSFDDSAIPVCCVSLLILQMTSCFHIMSQIQIWACNLQHCELFAVLQEMVLLNCAPGGKVSYC